MLIDAIIDWKKVAVKIKEMTEDDSRIEKIIDEQIVSIIKKANPERYMEILEKNKAEILEIKEKLTKAYYNKLKEEIYGFCNIYNKDD